MSRADDPDIEALEQALTDALPLTMAINAWEGRWPLNTYADIDASKLSQAARDRLKTAEAMTQKEFGELLKRRAAVRATYAKAAANYDAFDHARRLRRGAGRPRHDRQHGDERVGLAARLPGADACRCWPTKACRSDCSCSARTDEDAALFWRCGLDCRRCVEPADLVGVVA